MATTPADGVCVASDIPPVENAFEKALFGPPTHRAVVLHQPGAGAKSTFVPEKNIRPTGGGCPEGARLAGKRACPQFLCLGRPFLRQMGWSLVELTSGRSTSSLGIY